MQIYGMLLDGLTNKPRPHLLRKMFELKGVSYPPVIRVYGSQRSPAYLIKNTFKASFKSKNVGTVPSCI